MADFINRLTSRKFLITIAGIVIVTLHPELADKIIALIIAYVGSEGAADVVQRYAKEKTTQAQVQLKSDAIQSGNIDFSVDKGEIVAGNPADDIAM